MGRDIDKMFSDAKQQFGNINLIINSETSLYQGFNNHLENLGNSFMNVYQLQFVIEFPESFPEI